MHDRFPIEGPLLPHDPPATGLYHRMEELQTVLTHLNQDGRVAIWAPRYSGRTTFLYCLEHRLRLRDELAVYVSPEPDLIPTDRKSLFRSLATQIASRLPLITSLAESPAIDDWDKPDSLERFLRPVLENNDIARLTIIFDDCDKLLSTSLVTLLRTLRDLHGLRARNETWGKIAFVVAGAVSFRNLKLLDSSELSPFEQWKPCPLNDLNPREAEDYLTHAFIGLGRHVEHEAIERAVEFAGGDLRRLNVLGREILKHLEGTDSKINAEFVDNVARVAAAGYGSDPSIAFMLSTLTHDPLCLGVVDRLLSRLDNDKEVPFESGDLHVEQKQRFEISNQELSGGFLLEENASGSLEKWKVRNRYCAEVLRRHFTTRQLVRAFLDLGKYERARVLIENRLARELDQDFKDREKISSFDETAIRDIVEWFWSHGDHDPKTTNRPSQIDRVVAGFEALAFVMAKIFSIEQFTLYEVVGDGSRLVANEFSLSFGVEPAGSAEISLQPRVGEQESPSQEVRAFSAKVYILEIEEQGRLKFSMPLRNLSGRVTGVLTCRTARFVEEDWATLFVRIPIIERAVNAIWRRLSRYELDQYKGLSGAMPWISVQFDSPAYDHFRKRIARFPEDLPAKLLEFREGIIFRQVITAMKERRSLLIFELSHVNANVLFELGLAIGLNRPGLLIRDKDSRLELAALDGFYCELYGISRPLGETFFDLLRDRWVTYLSRRGERDFVYLLADRVTPPPKDSQLLLVIDHHYYRDSKEFRRAIEKAADAFGLKVSYLWEGGTRHDRLTVDTVAEDPTSLVALYKRIQRARVVVARVEKIQNVDHNVLRFLATGVAMGLAEKRGESHCVLTCRQIDQENREISRPADFKGLDSIPFDPRKAADFTRDVKMRLRKILV
jgi:hypothetical protein